MATSVASALKREEYPHDILFFEEDDIYWLRGNDLERARQWKVIGSCYDGQEAIGFDAESAYYYIRSLLELELNVGVVHGTTVKTIRLQGSGDPTKVKSTLLWLAPVLLYGQRELTRLITVHSRKRASMAATVEQFRHDLTIEVGRLYVFQVGLDEYDVDWTLTATPREVVEALAVAAHLEGRKLKCQLVEPKGRRRNRRGEAKPKVAVSEPVSYGQLRFML